MKLMKKLTEEMLGLSGFRSNCYVDWLTHSASSSRLCFTSPNPLGNFKNSVSWEARDKIFYEINKIVFDKTNSININKSLKL